AMMTASSRRPIGAAESAGPDEKRQRTARTLPQARDFASKGAWRTSARFWSARSPLPLFAAAHRFLPVLGLILAICPLAQAAARERVLINDNWRFTKGDPTNSATSLLYDLR